MFGHGDICSKICSRTRKPLPITYGVWCNTTTDAKMPAGTHLKRGIDIERARKEEIRIKKEKYCIWFEELPAMWIKKLRGIAFTSCWRRRMAVQNQNKEMDGATQIFVNLWREFSHKTSSRTSNIPLNLRTRANETELGKEEGKKPTGYRGQIGIHGEY